jgi:hypothetical protein
MGVKQHLMCLGWVRHQPEGSAGTELQVRDLESPIHTAHDQTFFTPVKLEGFAKSELQGNKRLDPAAFACVPVPNKVRDPAVAAGIALLLNLSEQRPSTATVLLGRSESAFSAVCRNSLCGVSLPGVTSRLYTGGLSSLGARTHFRIVFREMPVRFAI